MIFCLRSEVMASLKLWENSTNFFIFFLLKRNTNEFSISSIFKNIMSQSKLSIKIGKSNQTFITAGLVELLNTEFVIIIIFIFYYHIALAFIYLFNGHLHLITNNFINKYINFFEKI